MAQGKEKALMGKSPSKAQLNSIARAFAKAADPGGRLSDQDMTRALNMLRGMASPQKKAYGGKTKKAKGMKRGGKMKAKGMARGGKAMMKKSKGMARGGKMMKKSKGMARGGKAKR